MLWTTRKITHESIRIRTVSIVRKLFENPVFFEFEQRSCDFENRNPAIRIIRIRFPVLLRIYPAELEVI
jgi:hypothetical protein